MNTSDLISQLTDSSDTARACAADKLGVISLLDLLESKKIIDRRAAVLALGKIGSVDAITALQAALKDKDASCEVSRARRWRGRAGWRRGGAGGPGCAVASIRTRSTHGRCAGAARQAKNVLLVRNAPEAARINEQEWNRLWAESGDYRAGDAPR